MNKKLVAAAIGTGLGRASAGASAAVVRSDFSRGAEGWGTGRFAHYEFALNKSAGWRTNNPIARVATDDDIRAVLANMHGIWINADWKTGDDQGNDDARLDNLCLRDAGSWCTVALIPEPGALALFGLTLGLLGLSRKDSRSTGHRQP